ncbi:MAG: copper-binding protein [Phycisphaerales bacterium]|nr:copper-binding protein [Phycisphaerales bacterium]
MSSTSRSSAQLLATLTCCATSIVLPGCKKQSHQAAAPDAPKTSVIEYTVRGKVIALPGPMGDLSIQHEAIPEFRNPDGKLGMNTMQMPFPLAEGMTLPDTIAPGDLVEFTFAVEYVPDFTSLVDYHLIAIDELPADTQLDFSPLERQGQAN